MGDILEIIICGLFVFGIVCLILGILFMIIINPCVKYQLNRKSNRIQWRCQETYESRNRFINGKSDSHVCNLSYKVIPSEVNKITRIYGNNDWKNAFHNLEFKNKKEFQEFVKDFKTINDIETFFNNKEGGILWCHPPF